MLLEKGSLELQTYLKREKLFLEPDIEPVDKEQIVPSLLTSNAGVVRLRKELFQLAAVWEQSGDEL